MGGFLRCAAVGEPHVPRDLSNYAIEHTAIASRPGTRITIEETEGVMLHATQLAFPQLDMVVNARSSATTEASNACWSP